ncbi:MAG: hypothetical protein WEB04_11960 [Dehalococcoidia bacterium]
MAINTNEPAGAPSTPEHVSEADFRVDVGPNGPALAAVLGAGIGVFVLGFLTTLNEMAVGVHDWLIFQERVGPLSGKTTMTGIAWLVSWAVLHLVWWKRDVPFVPVMALTIVLMVAGNVLMLPPVFQRLAVD